MTRLTTALALAAMLASPAIAADFEVGPLTVDAPWSRPGIPNRPAAAYMEIANTGETADRLVAASSPAFGSIEIHSMEMDDGVMKMFRVDAIEIPPGGSVALAPRGFHLMLFDADAPFAEGESFPVTLEFEDAGSVEVTVAVARMGGMDHGTMDHGESD